MTHQRAGTDLIQRPAALAVDRSADFLWVLLIAVALILTVAARAPASFPCEGDCHDDGRVSINELITGVNIALGTAALSSCQALDLNGNGAVSVNELVKAVTRALGVCFDATIALPGLPGTTDVVYDSLGIPHIYGPDLNSVAYAQGYVHAAHRFWQMDLARRSPEGRLSELFGSTTLATDVTMRTILTSRDGRRLEEVWWEHLQAVDPESAAAVQAYTDGVNAWLADMRATRNGATLPPEYQFIQQANDVAPWRAQDSIAVGRGIVWGLDNSVLTDTMYDQEAWETLDEAVRKDVLRAAPLAFVPVISGPPPMTSPHPASSASEAPAPVAPPPGTAKAVRILLEEVGRSPLAGRSHDMGSNNWVVAPSMSDSGFAMLASDPHGALRNPIFAFMQHLDIAGAGASGGWGPGLPGIRFIGYNDAGAWGATYAKFDVVDVYVETITTPPDYPAQPRTVSFNGQQVPVLRLQEQFNIKGQSARTYVIEVVPHHGPMLPDPNLNDGVVGLAATGMTLRWTGQDAGNDMRIFLDLMRAQNVVDFQAALRDGVQGAMATNFVWADVHGDIAYSSYAHVPQRPAGTVPYLPMPGTGEAEWLTDEQGDIAWLPEDKFPQAVNPREGFIATANNDPFGYNFDNDPLNDPAYFAFWYDDGMRAQRIQDMLSNRANLRPPSAKITMADMSVYQYDTASLEACRMLPFLFAAAEARPDLVTEEIADAIERLRAWTVEKPGAPACDAVSGLDAHQLRPDVPARAQSVSDEERDDAVGASIYHAWLKAVWRRWPISVSAVAPPFRLGLHLLEDIDNTDPAFQVYTKGPNGDSTLWDDPATPEVETHTEALLTGLGEALGRLEQQFGSPDMSTWLWGKLHQVRLQHSFGDGGITAFDLGPIPAPGGYYTVNVAPFDIFPLDSDDFSFSIGPSLRLVTLLDPSGIRATNSLAGGENGNPGSGGAYKTINPATHYGDLIPSWINGEAAEMRISRQEVRADAQRQVRYVTAEE